jgi:hypothetical protein
MNAKQFLVLGASVLTPSRCGPALAEERQGQYVRLAELEIDPALEPLSMAGISNHEV